MWMRPMYFQRDIWDILIFPVYPRFTPHRRPAYRPAVLQNALFLSQFLAVELGRFQGAVDGAGCDVPCSE